MNLLQLTDYRKYLKWRLSQLPGQRGELAPLARAAKIHVTQISQILNGKRDFTPDQAFRVSQYLLLNDQETAYFTALIAKARASDTGLIRFLDGELKRIRENDFANAKNHGENSSENKDGLSSLQRNTFFSAWYYVAVFLMVSIEGMHDVDTLATQLNLSRSIVQNVLDFLTSSSLCEKTKNGYRIKTRLVAGDDLSCRTRNRLNWRQKALEALFKDHQNDFFLTYTVSVSKQDKLEILKLLKKVELEIDRILDTTRPETALCVNLDFFGIRG